MFFLTKKILFVKRYPFGVVHLDYEVCHVNKACKLSHRKLR